MTMKSLLANGGSVTAPGVYDALTAKLAADAGFKALYLSGAAMAYTRLGRPDIGLVSAWEVTEIIMSIRDRVDVPMIVDADTGFGNALNVQRTVRTFERAGASAIQLEDQTTPKRCGHLRDKSVISAQEMVGKIHAAVDARASDETLIIARTDALAQYGVDEAVERAMRYAEAGADALFVEAPRSLEQLTEVARRLKGVKPLLANMVEGGDTPIMTGEELAQIGFAITIFPGGIVRALAAQAQAYYQSLAQTGSNEAFRDRMLNFNDLNAVIGTPEMLAIGQRYENI